MIKIISRSSTFPGVDLEYAQVETIGEAYAMITDIIRIAFEESGVCVNATWHDDLLHAEWPGGNKLYMTR